jgi:ketosteroid isomerase-like protein
MRSDAGGRMLVWSSNEGGALSTIITEHPNAELVRRAYEAFNTADTATLTELLDESVSWHTPGRSPLAGDREGREATFAQFGPVCG